MATQRSTHRQCCRPFSRGAILVLVWSALLHAAHWFAYTSLHLALPGELKFGFQCTHFALWLLLPVTGWVADAWLGRYGATIAGFFLAMITMLCLQAAFIMLQFKWTPIPAFSLLCIALLIGTVGFGTFVTNLLPFTLDQMIGASTEELSAAVQWYWWGYSTGLFTVDSLKCIPNLTILHFQDFLPMVLLTLSSLCFSAVLLSDCLYHKWLDPHIKTNNPIKMIFRVLDYARKTKYPRNRSAFTYLDEEQPSRLDFGKEKFGGPFTEEEVEDVKTVLRIIPLLVTAAGVFLSLSFNDLFYLHVYSVTVLTHDCVLSLSPLVYYLTSVVLIPAYRFILYPVFYNYTHSMLKRIGAGLFLCFVNILINLTLDTVGHLHSNTTHCMFDTNTGSTDTLPIPLYWLIIMDAVGGVGLLLVACSSFEFIMAQTPNRMRGFMMGLAITVSGVAILVRSLFQLPFQHFKSATPSCGFYYYLVLSLIILLIFVLFIIIAKHYKLRERERHINIQAIAEEHYERYLDQEEEYMRRAASQFSSNSNI